MDNKRKRTSADDGDHVEKKFKQPIVTEDANSTSSSEMTDCEIISLMMPNGLPANCTENPERNPRVHRTRTGQSLQGEFSGNRTEIIVWDSNDPAIVHRSGNEAAPTTTVNIISSDDEINDGDKTCFENPIGLIASISISQQQQQQQQIFAHPVLDNHNLDVIELSSDDDNYIDIVINSHYSIENYEDIDEIRLETISEESINSIPVRISIDGQQQRLFTLLDNHNLDVIDLTLDDDVINSHYSIENYEDIDEIRLETISEESINSIPVRISIDGQQQRLFTLLDNHNLDVIDLTLEDDVINSHYSIENYEDIDEIRLETISEESINSIPVRISIDGQQQRLSTLLDSNNLDVIDLTSEDDGDTNSYYSIEHDDESYSE